MTNRKNMTANQIRDSFKQYFEGKGHTIVPSAPMVIKDDPTLMFTNAGMNQWKDIILGTRSPEPRRRADSQKCLRVSGKHNDLEEVGHDTYHHTMFEMLGNWSFGDYFKEGAIDMAWEYLVDVLGLNPDDLYVTVFEGDPAENLERDNEAANFWLKHVPADHIINGNKHDNFWEMGDTGPCGPCSEIHLDSRSAEEKAKVSGASLVNQDDPQVIEIWNIVFMQYNRKADHSLTPLSMNVIDTGMGFERLVRALQGKNSNYDTDIFQPLLHRIEQLTGLTYGKNEETDIAMRVIADHLRAIAFSIADGQLPSNAKAGYVIRRILRRAVRYAYTFLGAKQAFVYQLVPTLVEEMGAAYPELVAQRELIIRVIKEEEDSFLRTLSTGISLLENLIAEVKKEGKDTLAGEKVFTLFDTYGFPLDLTELICSEQAIKVDEAGFKSEMQKQKERARNAAKVEAGDWVELRPGTEQFLGWDHTESSAYILRYREVQQKKHKFYELVLDTTPFYAEMGGQVGDTGVLFNQDERIEIFDTKRENNLAVHLTRTLPQNLTACFTAKVDEERRRASEANHSATHLLDQALKEVLGDHVEQKGSLVTPDYLRFDFSHFQKVSADELRRVEQIINARIREDLPLQEHRDKSMEEAQQMGAIGLFGEKYGDTVRVIQFGNSKELCGGCHAKSTGAIGLFRIVAESSVAAGIRRIEAITGKAAEDKMYAQQDLLDQLNEIFHTPKDLTATIEKMMAENAQLKSEVENYQKQGMLQIKQQLLNQVVEHEGVKVISAVLPTAIDAAQVKDMVFQMANQFTENFFCVIGSTANDKPLLTVMLSKDLIAARQLNAGQLVREAARLIKGGGGGAPHFATAGGKDVEGLEAAVKRVLELAQLS